MPVDGEVRWSTPGPNRSFGSAETVVGLRGVGQDVTAPAGEVMRRAGHPPDALDVGEQVGLVSSPVGSPCSTTVASLLSACPVCERHWVTRSPNSSDWRDARATTSLKSSPPGGRRHVSHREGQERHHGMSSLPAARQLFGLDLQLHLDIRIDPQHQHRRRRDVKVTDVEVLLPVHAELARRPVTITVPSRRGWRRAG